MKALMTIIGIMGVTHVLSGQSRPEIDLENFAEKRFQLQDDDLDYDQLYESLLLYYTRPLNLNKASREELASLYILSPAQLNSFIEYRTKFGPLLSVYELQSIPGFDPNTVTELRPFITVNSIEDPRPLLERILEEDNNYFLLRYRRTFPKSIGYSKASNRFIGDPNTVYGRFRVSRPHDFSIGFTFEKDAGEPFMWDPNSNRHGFDFYSGHILLEDKGIFKSAIVGDFQIQSGQGLVFSSGFQIGKGSETTNSVMKSSLGIRPYTSVLETGFFRGLGTTIKFGAFESTIFTSYTPQDGRIQSDTTYTEFDEYVNAIQATGFHRTSSELSGKNAINEWSSGYSLTYNASNRLKLGVNGLYSIYSKPIQKKPTNYNQFEFSGNRNWVTSVFGNFSWQNFMFFGEAALSKSGGKGLVAGFVSSLSPQLDFSWLIRHYDKDFHSFYSRGFGENSRNINEKGIYWGLKYRPTRKYELSFYFDRFVFPWLKYRTDAPSDGYEYLARITHEPTKQIALYLQYRQEKKELSNASETTNLNALTEAIKRSYIFNIDYEVNDKLSLRTRVQGSSYSLLNTTYGFTILQDVTTQFGKLKMSARFALFDTDDYNNRQYVYERDVLYSFSIPAYNGSGVRTYLLLQYPISNYMRLYTRYARFDYTDITSIGSGLSQTEGSSRSEVKVLLRLSF